MNWIKINDEKTNLPEEYKDVLVTENWQNTVQVMYYDSIKNNFKNNDDVSYELNEITAYMYLPEPFKEL